MKCFYAVFWSEVVILSFAGTFWTADGENVTWYEPPPEETLSDHNLDHKLKTVRLLEGVTDSPLSWNFSFSSDLTFDGLTVNFNGVNVAGVRSSGQAGLVNPSDQRYSFSWTATEKFTLIISNVTDADSGMFTCLVDLCIGFACNDWGSTIKVEVVEPPSITNISMNQTVIVCKDVTTLNLYCIAVGKPAPNVTWIKVSDNRSVTFPLNISGEGDEGTYRCTADNGVGNSVTRDVFITVLECPEITFVSRDPVVCEDSTVTLSCNATGKPTPNITWTRVTVNGTTDGVPLHPVVDGTFLISNINRSSNGSTYRCTATNGVGDPVNRTVTVTVRHSAVVDRIVNSSNTVIEGEYFNMTCYTSGEPRPNVYWIKVSNGARINGSILNFTNISKNDIDQYRCEAENDCGNNNSVRSIDVFYKPDSVELLSNSTEDSYCSDLWVNFTCKVSGANPAISKYVLFEHSELVASNNNGTWIQKLSEGKKYVYHCMAEHIVGNVNSTNIVTITVNVSASVISVNTTIFTEYLGAILFCNVSGVPPPDIPWFNDKNENVNNGSLWKLPNISRNDNGTYRCEASNDCGMDSKTFDLIVQYKPGDVRLRPNITNSKVCAEYIVNFTCSADANPAVDSYTLFENGSAVNTSSSGVWSITMDTAGQFVYRCEANNSFGFDKSTDINVNVEVSAKVINVNTTIYTEGHDAILFCDQSGFPPPVVSWFNDKNENVNNGSIWKLLNIRRNDNGTYRCEASNDCGMGSKTFDIIVQYKPEDVRLRPDITNSKVCAEYTVNLSCSADANPAVDNYTLFEDDSVVNTSSLGVWSITMNKAGQFVYRCEANNSVGFGKSNEINVNVEVSASVTSVNSTNFVEGEDVILFCDVSGDPHPSVSWINVTNMETVNDGAIWRLPNISRNNHGMYNCRANNTCNVDNKMVDIVVQFPPTKRPHSAIVRFTEGTQVNLSCPVDGRPEPNITWYNESDTTAEVRHEGREWTFQAESNNAGWYSCSAKNFLNLFKPVNVSIQLIVEKETNKGSPTNQSQVHCSLQVTLPDTEYLPDYDNLNSAPAQKLASTFVAEVDKLYENVTNYVRTEVIKLSHSQGGVIVSFHMYFTTLVCKNEGLDKLRDAVDKNKKLGNFTVRALKVIQVNEGSTGNPSKSSQKDGPPWPIIGGIIGAVVVVIIVILLLAWWVHNKRKCRRKDTKIHNSESEVLHGQNDIEDGAHARVNGGYADSGPPSANGTNKFVQQPEQQQQQAAAAPPAYAVVDKSKKKKKKSGAEDPYAEVEDPKKDKKTADPSTHDYAVVNKSKKKKKEEDENAYATVDKSKKSKKKPKAPGEVLYADLGDFQPVQPLPTVATSPEPLAPIKRPTPYEGTEYADITQFLKGNATLPEGQSTEMQPTYANAGGGQGAAANKENANTGGKGGGGDTEPKETPM